MGRRTTESQRSENGHDLADVALPSSGNLFESLFNSMDDSVSVIDVASFKIVRANKAFLRRAAKQEQETDVIGRTCYEVNHNRSEPCGFLHSCTLVETARTGCASSIEHKHFAEDGTEMYLEISTSPIRNHKGEIHQIIHVARDITERRLTARLLTEQKKELARSNAELEQFAYIVSHDLQEPLRMVTGFLELLARRYEGKLGSDADRFIGFAVDGAARMRVLIETLLAYSRAGRRKKDLGPCDCTAVVDQVVSIMQPSVEESGTVITSDPLPTVVADEVQLGQLFQNLIGNAVKFRSDEAPRVHLAAKQRADEWVFSVRDNGTGIDPEDTSRVFGVFQRLHCRADYPGTGIGLAICEKIVHRHGGRIWVESEPGKGSVFFFTIPKTEGKRG